MTKKVIELFPRLISIYSREVFREYKPYAYMDFELLPKPPETEVWIQIFALPDNLYSDNYDYCVYHPSVNGPLLSANCNERGKRNTELINYVHEIDPLHMSFPIRKGHGTWYEEINHIKYGRKKRRIVKKICNRKIKQIRFFDNSGKEITNGSERIQIVERDWINIWNSLLFLMGIKKDITLPMINYMNHIHFIARTGNIITKKRFNRMSDDPNFRKYLIFPHP